MLYLTVPVSSEGFVKQIPTLVIPEASGPETIICISLSAYAVGVTIESDNAIRIKGTKRFKFIY